MTTIFLLFLMVMGEPSPYTAKERSVTVFGKHYLVGYQVDFSAKVENRLIGCEAHGMKVAPPEQANHRFRADATVLVETDHGWRRVAGPLAWTYFDLEDWTCSKDAPAAVLLEVMRITGEKL